MGVVDKNDLPALRKASREQASSVFFRDVRSDFAPFGRRKT